MLQSTTCVCGVQAIVRLYSGSDIIVIANIFCR
jgi:hypothetical protein